MIRYEIVEMSVGVSVIVLLSFAMLPLAGLRRRMLGLTISTVWLLAAVAFVISAAFAFRPEMAPDAINQVLQPLQGRFTSLIFDGESKFGYAYLLICVLVVTVSVAVCGVLRFVQRISQHTQAIRNLARSTSAARRTGNRVSAPAEPISKEQTANDLPGLPDDKELAPAQA